MRLRRHPPPGRKRNRCHCHPDRWHTAKRRSGRSTPRRIRFGFRPAKFGWRSHGKICGSSIACHVHVARGIGAHCHPGIVSASAEISGKDQGRSIGLQFRGKHTRRRCLGSLREREIRRRCRTCEMNVASRIQRDGPGSVVVTAAEIGRPREVRAIGAQHRNKRIEHSAGPRLQRVGERKIE